MLQAVKCFDTVTTLTFLLSGVHFGGFLSAGIYTNFCLLFSKPPYLVQALSSVYGAGCETLLALRRLVWCYDLVLFGYIISKMFLTEVTEKRKDVFRGSHFII